MSPVSTAIEPAAPRAGRLPRIPAVAFPQRLTSPGSELPDSGTFQMFGPDPPVFRAPAPRFPPPPCPAGMLPTEPEGEEPNPPLLSLPPGPLGAEPAPPEPAPGDEPISLPPRAACPGATGIASPLRPRAFGPASVEFSLLSQNPPALGSRRVPSSLPPTIFQLPKSLERLSLAKFDP